MSIVLVTLAWGKSHVFTYFGIHLDDNFNSIQFFSQIAKYFLAHLNYKTTQYYYYDYIIEPVHEISINVAF